MPAYICLMSMSREESEFMDWWEKHRDKERKTFRQWLIGLPLGFIFATPIIFNFMASRFWYKRAEAVGNSQFNPAILLIAVAAIASFVGVFHKKMRWEQHENQYISLKLKKEQEEKDENVNVN